ncbi:MAG: TetR/AcrR family transcriptional regulator [Oscillospiraceae bacterium]|nr:TetR/AcrR family transcriptional regulator [Oscillospiraceae bacterium]
MPPKPKFTKEQIVEAAYELARSEGIDAVMAREVGKQLGTTASPIFTVFSGMDELKREVFQLARRRCIDYLSGSFAFRPAFKEFGLRWIRFALREPRLYEMLLLRSDGDSQFLINEIISDLSDRIIGSIRESFGLDEDQARRLLDQMTIYANGLAAFRASGVGSFTEEQISRSISEVCLSLVTRCQILDGSFDLNKAREMLKQPGRTPEKEET